MREITYIEHSGFLLETDSACFLFDYYKGDIPSIDPDKPFLVFVSHKHPDHYDPEIFKLASQYPHAEYFLSRDIPIKWLLSGAKKQEASLKDRIHIMEKNVLQDFSLFNGKNLTVETLKSTDAGVAYLITYEEHTYYHAGDLNLWVWEGESKQYNNNMKSNYFKELEKLKNRKIDAAFVPLDPRQQKDAFLGMESFLQYTDSQYIFPMHFWGNYDIIKSFLKKHPEYSGKVMLIEWPGQRFRL